MKLLRVLAGGMLLLLLAIGGLFWYAVKHQNQLVNLILAQVEKRTGLSIETSGSRLGLGTRLVVVLEDARVSFAHRESARLSAVRAVFSYWTLLHRTGLPLHSLVLEHGTIVVPRGPQQAPEPQSAASRLETVVHYLDGLSGVSRQFELLDISFSDNDHRAFAEHVNLVAHRAHYRHGNWPWLVNFSADAGQGPLTGARFTGDLELGVDSTNPGSLAAGEVFCQLPLHELKLGGFVASAHLDGNVKLAVTVDAQTTGTFTIATSDLHLRGPALKAELALGGFSWRGDYRLSVSRAELSNLELHHQQLPMLEGRATVVNPYDSRRAATFSAGGLRVELSETPNWLKWFRNVPEPVLHLAERIRSGTLMVNEIALKNPVQLETLNLPELARGLDINAALTGVSYIPPPEVRLPTIYQLDAQLNYSRNRARISQATSQIGGSSISEMSLDVNLSKAPGSISYMLTMAAWLDAGELYSAAPRFIPPRQRTLLQQLIWVHGHTPIRLQAKGIVEGLRPEIPEDYFLTAGLGDVQFELHAMPGAISLNSGSVELQPGLIWLRKVIAVPLAQPGNVVVNGRILPQTSVVRFRDLSVELHQIASEKWIALMVDPHDISVSGPIGGRLVLNSKPGLKIPTVVGKLTLDHGAVHPGFLRNPIVITHSGTLVLDGQGLILNLPASQLESEPLNFRLAVPDLNHPEVRIDASVARIDFEVMRFIRLPWSKSTPPQFFPVPVAGHIDANAGNFDKLAMDNISTDFFHDSRNWRVDNFRAAAFNGSIALNISGRARDDWINMKGTIRHMDAGPLFLLSDARREPPILGKFSATGDLWADTNTDFFNTLAGNVSLTMRDGTLNRFTLMKRILSLVNLKNYLTAQFPDPRKSGVPFKTLDADFRGTSGNFYTDNLRLNGPVMDITARGNIDFANNRMDMEIDLLALQTVNWLINNIPLVGKHLGSATQHLVGAYFQVHGPTDNPGIRPKPLTSVAEFVFRTLALPINIIAPNTIQ